MISLRLSAVDTLFFRDGTPFTPEGTAQESVGGLFPPSPDSVAGAVRGVLGRLNGCDLPLPRTNGRRNGAPSERVERLRNLVFEAPYLLKDKMPYIPVPRHILGIQGERVGWSPRALLGPGNSLTCDLGERVCLPGVVQNAKDISVTDLKPAERHWMRFDALAKVLQGELPSEDALLSQACLWNTEERIGLGRSFETRTAKQGMLYSARHVRLNPKVSIGLRVSGVPSDWRLPLDTLIPVGGEGRFAECMPWDDRELKGLQMPLDEVASSGRAMVIALTPLILDEAVCRGEAPLAALGDARVVSACLDRPLRIGGWNSLKRRPRPMRSVLPAGSVLFCQADSSRRVLGMPLQGDGALPRLGALTEYGYGVVAIGVWPKNSILSEEGIL